jgi:homeobox protein cut-like
MADLTASATADAAATATDIDYDGALGGEGGNKFQRAISAWRSMAPLWDLWRKLTLVQTLT